MSYPEKLIRGISNKDFIDANGIASASLFQFDETVRADGLRELSINWYDEEKSLQCVMDQKKEDEITIQFKVGTAILSRMWIDDLIGRPNTKGFLSYERAPLEHNESHGNLLLKNNDLTKQLKTVISAGIANCVEEIRYR